MNWRLLAACRDLDTAIFFPDTERGHVHDYSAGLAVCAVCPVAKACLEDGLGDRFGLWGGKTPSERAKIARQRARRGRQSDTVACSGCGAAVVRDGGRRRSEVAWCKSEACQREASQDRTRRWRAGREGVA